MPNSEENFITIENLGMAYRKAKVDLYYAGNGGLTELLKYEENLYENLYELLGHLNDNDGEWFTSEEFLGGWTLVPKKIDTKVDVNRNAIFSDPKLHWDTVCQECNQKGEKPEAEFRLLATPSVDFHVLSALWISLIGYKFESQLGNYVYGNRLKGINRGIYKMLSPGLFERYIYSYKRWRERGINCMKEALDSKKHIVTITTDIESFYHNLDPRFLLDQQFQQEQLGVNLYDKNLIGFNKLFINILLAWARQTPIKAGLPIGLSASAVIANLSLVEFDNIVKKEVVPLYYGRYVDDIILVMENGANFKNAKDAWDWIIKRSNGLLLRGTAENHNDECNGDIFFKSQYNVHHNDTGLKFSVAKSNTFILDSKCGPAIVNTIARQMRENTSEWRQLPSLPQDAQSISIQLVNIAKDTGKQGCFLRSKDSLSMSRAEFGILLENFHELSRILHPDCWATQRHAFLKTYIEHFLALPIFFDYATFLPKVIRLVTACGDFRFLEALVDKITGIITCIRSTCNLSIQAANQCDYPNNIASKIEDKFKKLVNENIDISFLCKTHEKSEAYWQKRLNNKTLLNNSVDFEQKRELYQRFYSHDLAVIPYSFSALPPEMLLDWNNTIKGTAFCEHHKDLLQDEISQGVEKLCAQSTINGISPSGALPYGYLFSTRPLDLTQLYCLFPDAFTNEAAQTISKINKALRGYEVFDKLPVYDEEKSNTNQCIDIPTRLRGQNIKIAVTSFETKEDSWKAAAMNISDPDASRFVRLSHLLNQILSGPVKPDYVILPELSMPTAWFLRIAHKLQQESISLISGIEYLHHKKPQENDSPEQKKYVSNQIWAALSHSRFWFPVTIVCRHEKQRPAIHEGAELHSLNNTELFPQRPISKGLPDLTQIIKHGDFIFGMLICSELTNIDYRASFRGKVDAVFVAEWNQDTETFNSLVESAALDIHAYIIQCNNRAYGDSRIRAPYKDDWKRDVVRLKGGTNDFFVIGEIDVQGLREFQSYHRSPYKNEGGKKPLYKPVPDGFQMSDNRKVLPKG